MSMEKVSRISKLWAEMESQNIMGIVKRLYSPDIKYHIYATYSSDDRYYGLGVSYHNDIKVDVSAFESLREIKVKVYVDTSFEDHSLLLIQLVKPQYCGIFASLCESLIASVVAKPNEVEAIRTVINQLEKWRTLFKNTKIEGMTPSQQLGLYGELSFLRKLMQHNQITKAQAVEYWVGYDSAIRDFQGENWAIEIKTSAANNAESITINGERQLDDTLLENLVLYHYAMEVSKYTGETLPQLIRNIRKILEWDEVQLNQFNENLTTVGYFDVHEELYTNRAYLIRNAAAYKVCDNFPRIKENELRSGVSELTYEISVSQCQDYLITNDQLFNIIISHD